jgi:tetratricopeptide (TPR) repeat protein
VSGWFRSARFVVALLALCLISCASHSDKTKPIRTALDAAQPRQALAILNDKLEVDSEKEIPDDPGGDNALYLLDRSMILQALGQYAFASRDLELSDKQIEVLDLSRGAGHELGKYLFSDDTGPYKAPAYEKLLINTMGMVNYLARGDLNGARIEARRLTVMQKYLSESEGPGSGMIGPGSYLAGFAFEKSGKADEALRFYDEALQTGSYPSLAGPVRRLAERSGYRTPRIRALLESAPAPAEGAPAAASDEGEILVIVNFGRVPPKVAKRVPIGLALTYASGALSPTDHARANALAAQGLVTWVNFPELGRGRGEYDSPGFALDGKWMPIEGVLAVDREAKRAWEDAKGTVVASAITRMVARVVAGEAVRRSTDDNVLGLLLSLGTQATLTAMDTPDTRSWETLPARIAIGRVTVKPGRHTIDLVARGQRLRKTVDVAPSGFAVANLTVLR